MLLRNLKAVLGKSVDVVVEDTVTGYNNFLSWGFKIKTGATVLQQAEDFLKSHIYVPIIAGVVILILVIWCICSARKKKKSKVNPDDGMKAKP